MGSKKARPPPRPKASSPPKPLAYAPRARPSSRPRPPADLKPSPFPRSRHVPLMAASLVAGGIGFYTVSLAYSLYRPYVPAQAVPADVSDRYDRTANRFDDTVGGWESRIGITRLRRKLAAQAEGHVLEVSAGTGRNTAFYDWGKLRSLTLVDRSAPMLDVARRKWEEAEVGMKAKAGGKSRGGLVEFRTQSALERIEGPRAGVTGGDGKDDGGCEGKFDTVVQTMGLCSTARPEKLLQRMGEVVKPDGKILLLEHGRSGHAWLDGFMDKAAAGHADVHGCWWNKDIGAIVEDSGLEVVRISRPWYHLGTTWWVELKKKRGAEPEGGDGAGGAEKRRVHVQGAKEAVAAPEGSWWVGWKWT